MRLRPPISKRTYPRFPYTTRFRSTLAAADDLASGVGLAGVRVGVGLASSLGDARRALDQRGISVNGVKAEPGATLSGGDLLHGRWVLLRKGKKGWDVLDGGPARVV